MEGQVAPISVLILRSGAFAASRRMVVSHYLMVRDGAEEAPPHHEVPDVSITESEIAHARFHPAPRFAVHWCDDRRRHHRLHHVPLCRRSGEPDGGHRHHAGAARRGARVARPRRSRPGAIRALLHQCRAVQVRRLLPVSSAGLGAAEGAHAGDAGARHLRHRDRHGVRHSDGHLFGAAEGFVLRQGAAGGVADRHLAADLPDRHSPDLSVRGDTLAGCPPSGAAMS